MDGELERILKQEGLGPRPRRGAGMGNFLSQRPDTDNTVGRAPGLVGDTGKGARRSNKGGKMSRVFLDVPREECPSWFNEKSFYLLSRFLEDTFRNFQVNTRPPSHIAPPFTAKIFDLFPAGTVTIPAGAPGVWTTIVTGRVPRSRNRGEIHFAGQSAENASAFSDLEWQIRVNGTPYQPYLSIRIQLWEMVPITQLCAPIHLRAGDVIELRARSVAAGPHEVMGRLCGYTYQVRSEAGDEIQSTLVD